MEEYITIHYTEGGEVKEETLTDSSLFDARIVEVWRTIDGSATITSGSMNNL